MDECLLRALPKRNRKKNANKKRPNKKERQNKKTNNNIDRALQLEQGIDNTRKIETYNEVEIDIEIDEDVINVDADDDMNVDLYDWETSYARELGPIGEYDQEEVRSTEGLRFDIGTTPQKSSPRILTTLFSFV